MSGPFIVSKSTTPFPTVPQPNRAIETLFMGLPPLLFTYACPIIFTLLTPDSFSNVFIKSSTDTVISLVSMDKLTAAIP